MAVSLLFLAVVSQAATADGERESKDLPSSEKYGCYSIIKDSRTTGENDEREETREVNDTT
jgi:hypothetical protein